MQTLSIQPVSPVIPPQRELTPRAPRPQGPVPAYWAETAPHPFVETVRAAQPVFARRQPASSAAQPYIEEAGWVMGDAVEQSVSRWLIFIGGSAAAAAMGALLGGVLSM
ncbi:MAG: hypothetical protein ACT6RD_11175 [Brevundimonas sp.]|uniref:hypothetical protein n=1 Tax=Brevundimonas sp. TaxID=1871086 RepID=UPI0040341C9A